MEKEIEKIQELKNKISPFKIGDKVVGYWGSGGYDQEGIVIDNYVNYNNYMKFTQENCELACIVRLNNKILPTGWKVDNNCVIPWRQIKKISKD